MRSFHNVCLVLIGMEAQANIHYAMPVKNMIYDALNYGNQVKEAAKKHRENGDYTDSDEFLSGFGSGDRLTPVITITVYLGGEEWNAPRKLSDMYGEMDARLKPFLQDFDAHVLVPKEIKKFDGFRTSLKQVFEVLGASADREAMDAVITSDKDFQRLDNETVRAINDFINVNIPIDEKGKVTDMCKAWREQQQLGVAHGVEQERLAAVSRMIKKGCSKEFVLSLDYSEAEYEKAQEALLVQA